MILFRDDDYPRLLKQNVNKSDWNINIARNVR
jgi:hypothetical protein